MSGWDCGTAQRREYVDYEVKSFVSISCLGGSVGKGLFDALGIVGTWCREKVDLMFGNTNGFEVVLSRL